MIPNRKRNRGWSRSRCVSHPNVRGHSVIHGSTARELVWVFSEWCDRYSYSARWGVVASGTGGKCETAVLNAVIFPQRKFYNRNILGTLSTRHRGCIVVVDVTIITVLISTLQHSRLDCSSRTGSVCSGTSGTQMPASDRV